MMEFIVLLIVVVAFIWLRSSIANHFREQNLLIGWLKSDVAKLSEKLERLYNADTAQGSPSPMGQPHVADEEPAVVPLLAEPAPSVTANEVEPVAVAGDEELAGPHVFAQEAEPMPESTQGRATLGRINLLDAPIEKAPKKKSFFQRHPDLEKFVGENLINKIGIAILVLGIGFFVKYAIDKDWINEAGRLAIGILAGGALIGIAHRLRLNFASFSSVLIGGGLSVLYFSIGIGFHDYHLLSQTAAFAVMVLVTVFAVALSLLYNRKELAVLALIGGFGTPFFVSTGEGNYAVLFSYLLILNVGMLVLAVHKKWSLVNILSYLFTVVIYGAWLNSSISGPDFPHLGALLFGLAFYLVFFLMNVGYNILQKQPFKAIDVSLLLSNSFLFFAAGMVVLKDLNGGMYQGLFTVALGVFNFAFAYGIYRKSQVDRNLFFLLVGLVLTFISLAVPIQLKGNYITLFWSAEAVLLLWLSFKSGIKLVKVASVVVLGLMLVSLVMDWQQLYWTGGEFPVIANKAFVTSLVSLAGLVMYRLLLRGESEGYFLSADIPLGPVRNILQVGAVVLLYMALFNEFSFQMDNRIGLPDARTVLMACYNFTFMVVLAFTMRRRDSVQMSWTVTIMVAFLVLMYLFTYNPAVIGVRQSVLNDSGRWGGVFMGHFYFVGLLLYVLGVVKRRLFLLMKAQQIKVDWVYWAVSFLVVYVLSAELDHVVMRLFYHNMEQGYNLLVQNHKFGYPVLWGLVSFVLMVIGMQSKIKTLRIISLSLFALTILKLFVLDLRGMSEGGKILAFVSLGILMLVVSFMYQRLKKLIVEPQTNE